MSYVALYRRFRPQTFDEVSGQDHIITTLRNQVIAGRTQHAYLFCGTRGTGKTTVAKILSRAVNCEHPKDGNPCNECATCKSILAGKNMNVIEIDAASNNGVDNVREIIEEVRYRPTQGAYRVYIIDEVHMLSPGAFNALLKTIEEPPSYVMFILATTEAGKIPVTILSRCQRYDFRRMPLDVISARMRTLMDREGIEAEEEALRFVARKAEGSMRDALSLLDLCIAATQGSVLTYENALSALGAVDTDVFARLLKAVRAGDAGASVRIFEEVIEKGREASQFVSDYIWYLRDLLLLLSGDDESVDVPRDERENMRREAEQTGEEALLRQIRLLGDLQNTLRSTSNRRAMCEVAMIRLARPQMEGGAEGLRARVAYLEEQLEMILNGGMIFAQNPSGGDERDLPIEEPPEDTRGPAPNAAPEDLQRIRESWMDVCRRIHDHPAAAMLKKASLEYDAVSMDGKLYVQLPDSLSDGYLSGRIGALTEELTAAIEAVCGVHASLVLRGTQEKRGDLYAVTVDDIVREQIHFDVEPEDL